MCFQCSVSNLCFQYTVSIVLSGRARHSHVVEPGPWVLILHLVNLHPWVLAGLSLCLLEFVFVGLGQGPANYHQLPSVDGVW
jgi:hypothetical protein